MPPDESDTYGNNIFLLQVYHNRHNYARRFSLYTLCKERSWFLYLSSIGIFKDLLKTQKTRMRTFLFVPDVVKYTIYKVGNCLVVAFEREKHGTGTGNSSGRHQRCGI